jgi:hypothetical protein
MNTEELMREPTEQEKADLLEAVSKVPEMANILRRILFALDKYKAYHDITIKD